MPFIIPSGQSIDPNDINQNLGRLEFEFRGETVIIYPDSYSRSQELLRHPSDNNGFIDNLMSIPINSPQIYKNRFEVSINTSQYEILLKLAQFKRYSDLTLNSGVFEPIILRDYTQPDFSDFFWNAPIVCSSPTWETAYSTYNVRIIDARSESRTVYARNIKNSTINLSLIQQDWQNIESNLQCVITISGSGLPARQFIPYGSYNRGEIKQSIDTVNEGLIDTASRTPLVVRQPYKYNVSITNLIPISGTIRDAYEYLKYIHLRSIESTYSGVLHSGITLTDFEDVYYGKFVTLSLKPAYSYAVDQTGTIDVTFLELSYRI